MSFAILGIFFCFLAAIYGLKSEKMLLNPLTIFGIEWAVILVLSMLCLYTLYMPKDNTYRIMLEGILSFFAGYAFYRLGLCKIRMKKSTTTGHMLNYPIMYVFLIVCCIYYFFNLVSVVKNVGLFNLQNVQRLMQSGGIGSSNSPIMILLLMFVIQPGSFILPIVASVDFWFGERNKTLIIGTLIMTFMKMLATASRSTFISIAFYFIVSGFLYLFILKKNKEKKIVYKRTQKRKKTIRMVIILGVIAFVLMTISRGANIFRNLYYNFAMPPIMFEKWAAQVEEQNLTGYGMASLNGFFYPFLWILSKIIGGMPGHFQNIYDLIMLTDTQWQWIGEKVTANAYVSMFWFSYLDGRDLGIILEMVLFGILCGYAYKKSVQNPNAKNVAIYCMILYCIVYSFVRMQFAMTTFAISFLYIKFLVYSNYKIKLKF